MYSFCMNGKTAPETSHEPDYYDQDDEDAYTIMNNSGNISVNNQMTMAPMRSTPHQDFAG